MAIASRWRSGTEPRAGAAKAIVWRSTAASDVRASTSGSGPSIASGSVRSRSPSPIAKSTCRMTWGCEAEHRTESPSPRDRLFVTDGRASAIRLGRRLRFLLKSIEGTAITAPPCGLAVPEASDQCGPYERPDPHRVDRRDVESDPRLHQDQPGLHALLCGDVRRAVSRRPGPSLRAGLRPADGARQARRTAAVAILADGLRQLDERSVPPRRARRLHPRGRPGHAPGRLAYLSSLDQAIGSDARATRRRIPRCGRGPADLVGGERREPSRRPARGSTTCARLRRGRGSCRSSPCSRIWVHSTCPASTGSSRAARAAPGPGR